MMVFINIKIASAQSSCNANFTYTTNSSNTYSFTSLSTSNGTITNYVWDFGDGSASNQPNPFHIYTTSGNYTVCLTIAGFDSIGSPFMCTYCDSSFFAQAVISPCVASYSYNFVTPNSIEFMDNSTTPFNVIGYSWTFGDGGISSLQNPSHSYTSTGTYYPCLVLSTTDGSVTYLCMYCDTIQVSTTSSSPCFSNFSYTTVNNSTFNFTDLSSGIGSITNYNWAFGDGSGSTQQNPVHNYLNSGIYNVCLTIQGLDTIGNPFSCTFCDSVVAQIGSQPCNAFFTYNTFDNSTFNFTNCSIAQGPIIAYNWTFGDGGQSTLPNPVHTYPSFGNYTTCLSITYLNSNSMPAYCSYCVGINASNPLINVCSVISAFASLSFNDTVSCADNTTCSNCSFFISKWYFGDGDSSYMSNPIHTYTNPGTYNLCLKTVAYNLLQHPCSQDSICINVVINPSSIQNIEKNPGLTTYPNPITTTVNLAIPKQDFYTLRLTDLMGKTILQKLVTPDTKIESIDMANYNPGIYFISLSSERNQYRVKMLKQ